MDQDLLHNVLLACRATWPGIDLPAETFAAHLAGRLRLSEGTMTAPALAALHTTDLYLACACLHGVRGAIEACDKHFLVPISGQVLRRITSGPAADEVVQAVRARLFVGDGESPPKIADYGGHGPLGGWLRTLVQRAGLNHLRSMSAAGRATADHLPSGLIDPELRYLKERYRAEFGEAFRTALAVLPATQREILRLYYVNGLGVAEIAALRQVHHSTVARWIISSREEVLKQMRGYLAARLQLTPKEFDSLAGLLRSQLDLLSILRAPMDLQQGPQPGPEAAPRRGRGGSR